MDVLELLHVILLKHDVQLHEGLFKGRFVLLVLEIIVIEKGLSEVTFAKLCDLYATMAVKDCKKADSFSIYVVVADMSVLHA